MSIHYLAAGLGVVFLLVGTSYSAETRTLRADCTFSASFVEGIETHLDTNGDNISAGINQGINNCHFGRFSYQAEAEYLAPLPAPVNCPAGTLEFRLQQARTVNIEEKTGDQLFEQYATNEGTLCLREADLTFTFSNEGTYTGGTGRFEGASGSFEVEGSGSYLIFGSKGGVFGGFGQYTGTSTGTLTLPTGQGRNNPNDQD